MAQIINIHEPRWEKVGAEPPKPTPTETLAQQWAEFCRGIANMGRKLWIDKEYRDIPIKDQIADLVACVDVSLAQLRTIRSLLQDPTQSLRSTPDHIVKR